MTQIQLLFDQERKSLKPGNVELLKRVIRSEEGTLTGYIQALEGKLNLTFEAPVTEAAMPFMATNLNSSLENSTTLN
jgi:hypothetical protein